MLVCGGRANGLETAEPRDERVGELGAWHALLLILRVDAHRYGLILAARCDRLDESRLALEVAIGDSLSGKPVAGVPFLVDVDEGLRDVANDVFVGLEVESGGCVGHGESLFELAL